MTNLHSFLSSFQGQRTTVFLTSSQNTTGTINTILWDSDNENPTALYLVATEDRNLAGVLIPWAAVAGLGRVMGAS